MPLQAKKDTTSMKTSKFLSTVLLYLVLVVPCHAQNKLFNKVYSDVKKIEKITKDPIIIIGPVKTYSISTISIKDSSNVIAWQWYYLLYKEANKNKLIKYVETLEDFEGKKIFKSQTIQFTNDTLFGWLSSQKQKIQNEEILPFIYVDTAVNVPYYKQGFVMHTFPFKLAVNFYEDRKVIANSSFEFDETAMKPLLMPDVMELPKNLNYEYNRRLQVFQLYTILTNVLSNYTDKLEFF